MSKGDRDGILGGVARRFSFPDASFPILYQADVPPSFINVPFQNAFQFVHLRDGTLGLPRTGRTVRAPALLVVPPETPDIVKPSEDTGCSRILAGEAFIEQMSIVIPYESVVGRTTAITDVSLSDPGTAAMIASTMEEIGRELTGRDPHYESMVRASFTKIVISMARCSGGGNIRKTHRDKTGARVDPNEVVALIQATYAENHTLQGLAARYDVNPSYLSRLFREKTGVPLFEYINRIRVQKACVLLKRSDLPILEIALSVGYNNLSFFNRYFRKVMGVPPTEYRRIAKA